MSYSQTYDAYPHGVIYDMRRTTTTSYMRSQRDNENFQFSSTSSSMVLWIIQSFKMQFFGSLIMPRTISRHGTIAGHSAQPPPSSLPPPPPQLAWCLGRWHPQRYWLWLDFPKRQNPAQFPIRQQRQVWRPLRKMGLVVPQNWGRTAIVINGLHQRRA